MSGYRLLVAWDVIEKPNNLPIATRRALKDVIVEIGNSPDLMSDYLEPNDRGISLDVHLNRGFAIKYWTDFADRHVKILDVEPAD